MPSILSIPTTPEWKHLGRSKASQTTALALPQALAALSLNIYSFFRAVGTVSAAEFGGAGRIGWEGTKHPVDPTRQVASCQVPCHPRGSTQALRRPRDRNSPCGFPRLVMNEPKALMEASKAP